MFYAREFLLGTAKSYYDFIPQKLRRRVHEKRLRNYLKYIKENSPYYARLLKDIDVERCPFSQIPTIDKKESMAHFDEMVTDPSVKLENIRAFIADEKNRNKKFLGKYYIARTSGSTWTPTTVLYNRQMVAMYNVSAGTRMHINHFPYVSVIADPGFTLGSLSHHASGENRFYRMIDAVQPINQSVEQLNALNPKHIQGFSGTMIMLATEAEAGRLKIHPKAIGVTGEAIYPKQREYLKKVFGCPVYSVYNATELGHIATDCKCAHMHYFDDYLEIEPVDEYNNPVEDGKKSHHTLVTNFLSTTTPIVRYEMGDRVIIHREGCPCGNRRPWIELLGRSGIQGLEFTRNGRKIFVPMLSIEMNGFDFFNTQSVQIIVHDEHHIEVRLKTDYEGTWEQEKGKIADNFYRILREFGVDDVAVEVNDKLPEADPVTGKIRTILLKNVGTK